MAGAVGADRDSLNWAHRHGDSRAAPRSGAMSPWTVSRGARQCATRDRDGHLEATRVQLEMVIGSSRRTSRCASCRVQVEMVMGSSTNVAVRVTPRATRERDRRLAPNVVARGTPCAIRFEAHAVSRVTPCAAREHDGLLEVRVTPCANRDRDRRLASARRGACHSVCDSTSRCGARTSGRAYARIPRSTGRAVDRGSLRANPTVKRSRSAHSGSEAPRGCAAQSAFAAEVAGRTSHGAPWRRCRSRCVDDVAVSPMRLEDDLSGRRLVPDAYTLQTGDENEAPADCLHAASALTLNATESSRCVLRGNRHAA